MKYEPTNRRVLLWSIIVALATWAILLSLGAYLGLDPQTPDYDWRRVGIALAAIGGFLGFWLVLLARRRGR